MQKFNERHLQKEKSIQQNPAQTKIDLLSQFQQISKAPQIDQKLNKIQQFQTNIKQLKEIDALIQINQELCLELREQIGDGRTLIEKTLLSIVRTITELGSDLSEIHQCNKFYDIFKSSGLIDKIEKIILREFHNEQQKMKENNYSEITINILQAFILINTNQYIKHNIIEIFGKIICSSISKSIKKIKEYKKFKNSNQNELEIKNNEIEQVIKQLIISLKVVKSFSEYNNNRRYLVEALKIHDIISSLIHIQCPPEIHCQQILTLPQQIINQELLGIVLVTLSELVYNDVIIQYMQADHQLFQHIIPLIISIGSQINSNQTQQTKQFQSQQQITQLNDSISIQTPIIEGSLFLLQNLLYYNQSLCYQITFMPNLTQSLIKFSKQDFMIHQQQNFQIQQTRIKNCSNECLHYIWQWGSVETKKQMIIEYKYLKEQIELIQIGGRKQELNNEVILIILQNILAIIEYFNQSKHEKRSLQQLNKQIDGQIEEFGGLEDFQSYFFIQNNKISEKVKNESNKLIQQIINTNKHPSNVYDYLS